MRTGDQYLHYKGDKYTYLCIALPKDEYVRTKDLVRINIASDAMTPDGDPVRHAQLYGFNGVLFVDRDKPHVVYQAQKDARWWVREVDDFFGYVYKDGQYIKRFTLKG